MNIFESFSSVSSVNSFVDYNESNLVLFHIRKISSWVKNRFCDDNFSGSELQWKYVGQF